MYFASAFAIDSKSLINFHFICLHVFGRTKGLIIILCIFLEYASSSCFSFSCRCSEYFYLGLLLECHMQVEAIWVTKSSTNSSRWVAIHSCNLFYNINRTNLLLLGHFIHWKFCFTTFGLMHTNCPTIFKFNPILHSFFGTGPSIVASIKILGFLRH